MKLKKKSGLIGLISVLAGVSVVSVGFAAWVVSAGDTKSVEGNIEVETVDDQRHTIDNIANLANVQYGAPTDPASDSGVVLSYNATGAKKENLTISFSFTVRNLNTARLTISLAPTGSVWYKADGTPKYKSESTEGYQELNGYNTALGLGLVGALPSYTYNGSTEVGSGTNVADFNVAEPTSGSDAYTVTGKLTFKWGTHFATSWAAKTGDPVNPFVYYNTLADDEDNDEINAAAADAVASLSALEACLKNAKYTMTLTTEHVA